MKLRLWMMAVAAVCAVGTVAAQKESPSSKGYVGASKPQTPFTIEGLDRNRDYFLRLRFRISEKGQVADVEVEDGAFADPEFIRQVMRQVRAYQFKPATNDGVPVSSWAKKNFIFLNVTVGQLGRTFQKELDKLDGFFTSGNPERGRAHAKEMLSNVLRTRSEYVFLQGALARNEARVGSMHRAIRGLRASTGSTGSDTATLYILLRPEDPIPGEGKPEIYLLPDRTYLATQFELLMRATAAQGMLLEAQSAYRLLNALTPIPANDPRAEIYKAILNGLQGPAPLRASVEMDESGSWHHYLYRNRFRIEQVQGSLKRAELDCGGRVLTLDPQQPVDLVVPNDWRFCQLRLNAVVGTKLLIVESGEPIPAAVAAPAASSK